MSVTQYEKDGKTFWRVYLDLRSRKNPRIRAQRRINGIKSEREAIAEEKKLLRELTEELTRLEGMGLTWGEVIDRWESQQKIFPTKQYSPTTIVDYTALLRKWTGPWLPRLASDLNRGDGREIDRMTADVGKSAAFRKKLKNTINLIYTWGIEERHINGVHHSPVFGLEITPDRAEKKPEILTANQIKELLRLAKEQGHKWYPVWVTAVLTGCRSGELHELRRSDVEIIPREQAIEEERKPLEKRRYGFISVQKSWNTRFRISGATKAGYWRTVPISSEFYWFLLNEVGIERMRPDDFLLPRFVLWDKGQQAGMLRAFCKDNHLPSIRFHALRACFATQLISSGVPSTVVMKICGWCDLKTMQRYIRLAGVDEAGATEVLRFIPAGPTDQAVMEHMVKLVDYRSKSR
jgi:integrase